MFKNSPHLHPACEVEMANSQLCIGSRAAQHFVGSAEESDEAGKVYVTDDKELEEEEPKDQELDDVDEDAGKRPSTKDKDKGKKVEYDVEPGAGNKGHKYSGSAFQGHHSHSPALSTSTMSMAKRGWDGGLSVKSGSVKKAAPFGLHNIKPSQKGKAGSFDLNEMVEASNKCQHELKE
ncbi:hypothetical protein CPB97_004554 [Podila verticillata]|nr:hypothetical protein CPB97_004554 [Podila verticillata]